jgi:hypothetical protein
LHRSPAFSGVFAREGPRLFTQGGNLGPRTFDLRGAGHLGFGVFGGLGVAPDETHRATIFDETGLFRHSRRAAG